MKLSIIIPVYNTEKYLERCLDSCYSKQSLSKADYEIIAVNDGSTDNSLDLLQSLLKRITNLKVISQVNGGLSAARNTGLENATGNYVWFVDSDDWIDQDCLTKFLSKIEETKVDILSIYADDVEGGVVRKRGEYEYFGIESGKDFLLKHKKYNCAPFYIFKRSFLNEYNFRFAKGLFHEDNEFTPRVLYKACKVTNIEGYFYHVFKHPGTITTTPNPKKLRDLLTIADNYVRYTKEIPDSDKFIFCNVVGNNVNQVLYECYHYDKSVRKEMNKRIGNSKYAYYLKHSSIAKYKIEGILFSIFPKHCLHMYRILQLFNNDKGGQKKAHTLVKQ